MGSFEKMVYGVLLFSMCIVVFSGFHIKAANIYGVDVGVDLETINQSSQENTIKDTFKSMNTQLQADPTGSESTSTTPDVAGILFQSGVATVKLLSNSVNFLQNALVDVAVGLGISEASAYTFLVIIVSVFVVFAFVKVVTGRNDL